MWATIVFTTCLLLGLTIPPSGQSHPLFSRNQTSHLFPYYHGPKYANLPGSADNQILNKWIGTALKFYDFHRCVSSNIASSEDECFRLNSLDRKEIAVYFASGTGYPNSVAMRSSVSNSKHDNSKKKEEQKVVAIFTDSNIPKPGGAHSEHSAILALDPYPNKNFGHLVTVFYIDVGVESKKCKEEFQLYTTDETCITVAKKPRCPNRLERYTGGGLQPRRCHIDFLPTVYLAERFTTSPLSSSLLSNSSESVNAWDEGEESAATASTSSSSPTHLTHDLLNCVYVSGFAACPELRPLEDTRKVLCDGSAANSRRCDTSHTGVGTRCKLFQTCDRAVLLGGGWNRLHSDMKSFENILKMQESLSSLGFLPENIKTFYANGKNRKPASTSSYFQGRGGRSSSYDDSSYFSSAQKTGLRGNIRTICETRHCADSFFIYLNNPTTIEGDMLLWDVDYNGMVDELEVYTVKEFLSDLLGCEARRVIVVADQSNTDILLTSLKESKEHKNVVFFTAGLPNQETSNGELTNLFTNYSKSTTCIKHIHQNVLTSMLDSNPVGYDATSGISSKVSLIGAPCDLIPPVNSRELKRLYEGCQNVPTSVWFSAIFEDSGNIDYDINGGNDDDSEENSPNGRRS